MLVQSATFDYHKAAYATAATAFEKKWDLRRPGALTPTLSQGEGAVWSGSGLFRQTCVLKLFSVLLR